MAGRASCSFLANHADELADHYSLLDDAARGRPRYFCKHCYEGSAQWSRASAAPRLQSHEFRSHRRRNKSIARSASSPVWLHLLLCQLLDLDGLGLPGVPVLGLAGELGDNGGSWIEYGYFTCVSCSLGHHVVHQEIWKSKIKGRGREIKVRQYRRKPNQICRVCNH